MLSHTPVLAVSLSLDLVVKRGSLAFVNGSINIGLKGVLLRLWTVPRAMAIFPS
ncbi:hypothetical protein L914_15455 [Phytophthora nicotianae]|uniref:Uncharacterized protein n=1 Tax=Phytophthora nicotianae TaxID=4792 RepID=W2MP74_PHYNI|nr:hypothetical protein L914_15455 [Phytophthora nicotianae]